MKTFHSFVGKTLQPNIIETLQKHRSSIESNKNNENDKNEFMKTTNENNEYVLTSNGRFELKEKNAYQRAHNAIERQKYRQKDELMKQKGFYADLYNSQFEL